MCARAWVRARVFKNDVITTVEYVKYTIQKVRDQYEKLVVIASAYKLCFLLKSRLDRVDYRIVTIGNIFTVVLLVKILEIA